MNKIVSNRKPMMYIVTSNHAHPAELHAAAELQKYIYESTDTLLMMFADRVKKRGPEIRIGIDARNEGDSLPKDLNEEGFVIRSIGEDILIAGASPRGTLYGVYSFLERFLEFRCFTKDIEKIKHTDTLEVGELDIREEPAFEYREVYFRNAFDADFCAKNRLNSNMADLSLARGGQMKFYNFHHSFFDLVSPKKYFKAHPEYFSEVNGKRVDNVQLCLTNPEVVNIATETLMKWIEDNPHCKVFSVAQNDGMDFCTCEKCRAVDEEEGGPAGTILRFVNEIARRVYEKHPKILIHTFAYLYSRKVTKHTKPEKNVIVRLCTPECAQQKAFDLQEKEGAPDASGFMEDVREWSKICNHLYIWDYCVNFYHYPQIFPNIYSKAENIRLYKSYNVKGVLDEGNFSYGGGVALDDLKSYVVAKLLWDPSRDADELIDEFLLTVYGGGAKYIKEFIKKTTAAVQNFELKIFDRPNAPYITDKLLTECDELFIKAEAAAESEEIKRRIQREHLSVEYTMMVRIEDDAQRAAAVDRFAKKVTSFKLTEINERVELAKSYEYIKANRYALERPNWYNVYYLMK